MKRQEQRRARRQNRIRRLERYKRGKTYHGIIKGVCRRANKIITTPLIYCSTDTGLQGMNKTEAARRLMFADPDPDMLRPVLWIMDETDAEEWKKAGNQQWPGEWNPGGGET